MDQEIKAKWVAALRSGEYAQCTNGELYFNNTYCCLGVLGLLTGTGTAPESTFSYARLQEILQDHDKWNLIRRNDGTEGHKQHSFVELADYIEENL